VSVLIQLFVIFMKSTSIEEKRRAFPIHSFLSDRHSRPVVMHVTSGFGLISADLMDSIK
jgi:hypothetical protein